MQFSFKRCCKYMKTIGRFCHIRGVYDKTFFVWAFKIDVDSWKFSMIFLYILWDEGPIFMISASKEQLQQELDYTLLKPDCHSWWISKMQSGREDTLEEQCAIKFYFRLGKMPQKRMECFWLLFAHLAWIEHQFLSGIRDSRNAGSLWGMMMFSAYLSLCKKDSKQSVSCTSPLCTKDPNQAVQCTLTTMQGLQSISLLPYPARCKL